MLKQTFDSLELIIVNDGSTDGTAEYGEFLRSERVRLISVEHSGPAVARNVGIQHACGEWVAFLDDDDQWAAEKLRTQLDELIQNPSVGWCFTQILRIDEAGHALGEFNAKIPFSGAKLLNALDLPPAITTSAVIVRRKLLTDVGGFDPSVTGCEDLDLWVRLRAESDVVEVAAPLTLVRESSSRITRDWRTMNRSCLRLYRKISRESDLGVVRRECKKLLQENGLVYTTNLARAGELRAAATQLARALAINPLSKTVWRDIATRARRAFAR